ncbi:MAG: tyrosine-type recombinase/integrase [Patescibacteria group bacterium]
MTNYKKYLKSNKLKVSTIKNYLWHVKQFLEWLENEKLTEKIIKKYFDYLLKKYKRVNTINLRLKIINNYLKFNNKKFYFTLLSAEDANIKILSVEELKQFLNKPLKQANLMGLRDKALLELLYSSGLKVGQLVKLQKNQIDYIRTELLLEKNKTLKIQPSTWFYLKKYLEKRNDDIDYLFINFDRSNKSLDKSLSIRSVERIINKYAKGIKPPININPQILRNTLAHKLKAQGAQSEHIKSALHFQTKIGAKNYLKKI